MNTSTKTLNVRYWDTTDSSFSYPELSDEQLKYNPILNRPNTGICFSGGGTVSAALVPGYIKALENLGLMQHVRYISGVSGGTWGSAPYCYLPPKYQKSFFGNLPDDLNPDPSKLTKKVLKDVPEDSMTHAVTNEKIVALTVKNIKEGHSAYNLAVGDIFLKPFGIDYQNSYFTTDREAAKAINARQGDQLKFVFMAQDRPYLIMNGTMLLPKPNSQKSTEQGDQDYLTGYGDYYAAQNQEYDVFPFEFTPLYSGMRSNHKIDVGIGRHTIHDFFNVGGAFAESFGFNTQKPSFNKEEQSVSVRPNKNLFSLASPVGTSGAAFAKTSLEKKDTTKDTKIDKIERDIVPEFYYWNHQNTKLTSQLEFGDGGILENSGVTALLARKVENIVIFLTEPFDIENPPVSNRCCEKDQRYFGYNQIAQLFGQITFYQSDKKKHEWTKHEEPDKTVQVFEGSQFSTLKKALNDAKSGGGPVIVQGQYDVVPNKLLSVEGGWKCNVIWVCVDTCEEFNDQLPTDVKKMIDKKPIKWVKRIKWIKLCKSELGNFPAICTFGQNFLRAIQLTPMQANLLSNQAYWSVMKKQDMFSSFLKP